MLNKFTARVRVMRSYDYNHFEVELGTDEPVSLDDVNDLRKQAAVLVDEAVRQYRIAKVKESKRDLHESETKQFLARIDYIKSLPETERTVEQAALLMSHESGEFWKRYDDDDYYYEDPERECHFSMLSKFKDVKVRV